MLRNHLKNWVSASQYVLIRKQHFSQFICRNILHWLTFVRLALKLSRENQFYHKIIYFPQKKVIFEKQPKEALAKKQALFWKIVCSLLLRENILRRKGAAVLQTLFSVLQLSSSLWIHWWNKWAWRSKGSDQDVSTLVLSRRVITQFSAGLASKCETVKT